MADPLARPPEVTDFPLFASTSAKAGQAAAKYSGRRYAQITQILRDRGPMTIFETAAELGVFDHQISGRFGELEREGQIHKIGQRKPKPDTGQECELYAAGPHPSSAQRIADTNHRADQAAAAIGYPLSVRIEQALFTIAPELILPDESIPGIPYTAGHQVYRLTFSECPHCGRPLQLSDDQRRTDNGRHTKIWVCSKGCRWRIEFVVVSDQGRQYLAQVMRTI